VRLSIATKPRWSDIATWLNVNGKIEQELVNNARTVEAINIALQLRNKELLDNILTLTQLLDNKKPLTVTV